MSKRIKPILLFICVTTGLLAACDPAFLGSDRLTTVPRQTTIGGNGTNGLAPARLVDAFPQQDLGVSQ